MNIINKNIKTPVGELILGSYNNQLCMADWRYRKMRNTIDARIKKGLDAAFEPGTSSVIEQTENQLIQYFEGELKDFKISLFL